jgi:hypothetical protein
MERNAPKRRSKRQREILQAEIENQNIDQLIAGMCWLASSIDHSQLANLRHMELASLKRYKRMFHFKTRHARPENEELYAAVVRHFADSDTPFEEETVENFIYIVKNAKSTK